MQIAKEPTTFLCESIIGNFQILVVSDQEKHATSIDTVFLYFFYKRYPEKAKYPPHKHSVLFSRYKIVKKHAYLGIKMTSLVQKHKILGKVASPGV